MMDRWWFRCGRSMPVITEHCWLNQGLGPRGRRHFSTWWHFPGSCSTHVLTWQQREVPPITPSPRIHLLPYRQHQDRTISLTSRALGKHFPHEKDLPILCACQVPNPQEPLPIQDFFWHVHLPSGIQTHNGDAVIGHLGQHCPSCGPDQHPTGIPFCLQHFCSQWIKVLNKCMNAKRLAMKRQKQDVTQKGQRKPSAFPQVCLLGTHFSSKEQDFSSKALAMLFSRYIYIYTYLLYKYVYIHI